MNEFRRADYLSLAGAAGLDWKATAELDEAALERRLLGHSAAPNRVVEADFARVHVELRRKGVTLMLLWQEYRAAFEGRRTWAYTQFCEHYKVGPAKFIQPPLPGIRAYGLGRKWTLC